MTAPALELQAPADPFVAVRVMNRMTAAGFTVALEAGALVVMPASRLTAEQRAFIASHKPALVELLSDAHALHQALIAAGAKGLAWREGTDLDETRLLAAGEVLYSDGRMVHRSGRRYDANH